jgi:Peptidase family C25
MVLLTNGLASREMESSAVKKLYQSLCAFFLGLGLASTAHCDTAVVIPKAWKPALDSWKQYRQKSGHKIWELDAEQGAEALKRSIVELSKQTELKFVVLAGDVQASVPTFYHPSTALIQYGGTPTLASDNDYGDLDNDGVPELAVGRIPANSADQLKLYLDRVMEYENNPDFTPWRRDVHVVAGVGGFGVVADSVIEMTTRRFLSDTIPAWVNLSMTQASLTSHYCPNPVNFSEAALGRLNDGGTFWVYIGHGWIDELDSIQVGQDRHPIFTSNHLPAVKVQQPPIAVFLACYTGAFDAKQDCLAEQLVLKDSGPIAAIAASRVSGPYGLAVLSDGLLRGYFEQQLPTLGEIVLRSKQASMDDSRFAKQQDSKSQLGMINSIASAMAPKDYDLKAERQEHVWQVNLLGDPLMRMSYAKNLQFSLSSTTAHPGQQIRCLSKIPFAGKLQIEIAQRRGVPTDEVRQAKVDWRTDQGREAFDNRYRAANSQALAQFSVQIEPGQSDMQLQIPETLKPGKYIVRAFLEGAAGYCTGCQEIRVSAKTK